MYHANKLQAIHRKKSEGQPTIIPKDFNNRLALDHDLANSAAVFLQPRDSADQINAENDNEQVSSSPTSQLILPLSNIHSLASNGMDISRLKVTTRVNVTYSALASQFHSTVAICNTARAIWFLDQDALHR